MTTRMLIDARHKEETRVAVVSGNKIEELDFESAEHKQLKGNIYLAKVTRVEPSLQAAFVDYGGNRQGFLAFSEIHPDYYQIPQEDREQLLAEEAAAAEEEAALREQEEAEDELAAQNTQLSDDEMDGEIDDQNGDIETLVAEDEDNEPPKQRSKRAPRKRTARKNTATNTSDVKEAENSTEDTEINISENNHDTDDDAPAKEEKKKPRKRRTTKTRSMTVDDSENIITDDDGLDTDDSTDDDSTVDDSADGDSADGETKNANDDAPRRNRRRRGAKGRNDKKNIRNNTRHQKPRRPSDEVRAKRIALRRRYKIQDVIHRRQVLLIQVVKEERGNKGAALTSYLSLAGRYCVLMPNTSHGGGISRKINSGTDRKRLKSIVADMNLPTSMGCIIRTAGLSKTKVEIKRDFDYLARLWDKIRERTLTGAAPMLVHSDSDLIKRAIRDIYNRDISEVNIEGEDGFKAAKDFMKLLTPSHVKKLKQYTDSIPLFQRYGVEDQLNAMYHPIVQLKSGGYIVINPTEALVSIDINSGRSTKEHGIEATAVNTNLEAAREIARQLRLRDMAGLVVIDFIDMDHHSNIRKVERAMKDALRNDRARIQVGRISSFGLMEMSRQRLRTGVLEASTRECPHCEGTGLVRTSSSSALSALRMIEDEAARGKGSVIELAASEEAAIYVLNNKRSELADIESRYNVKILIKPNGEVEGAKMTASSSGPKPNKAMRIATIVDTDNEENIAQTDKVLSNEQDEDDSRGRKRRGRRGGKNRNSEQQTRNGEQQEGTAPKTPSLENSDVSTKQATESQDTNEHSTKGESGTKVAKPKRRATRSKKATATDENNDIASETIASTESESAESEDANKPKRKRASRKKAVNDSDAIETSEKNDTDKENKPKRPRKKAADKIETDAPKNVSATSKTEKPKRRTALKKDTENKPKETKETKPKKPAKKPNTKKVNSKTSDTPQLDANNAAISNDVKGDSGSDNPGSDNPGSDTSKPRKGWWQRTFG